LRRSISVREFPAKIGFAVAQPIKRSAAIAVQVCPKIAVAHAAFIVLAPVLADGSDGGTPRPAAQ